MENNDLSTPRVNRHRLHVNNDHSECLGHNRGGCPGRIKLEYDCREYIIQLLAKDITDIAVEQMARDRFPDWLVDFWWECPAVLRLEAHYVS